MGNVSYTLQDLPPEERPRERLQQIGVDSLSVQELLAIVVEKGGKGESVLTVAQRLLARFGSLANIKKASLKQLQEVKGIGFATACKLQASFKLGEKASSNPKAYGDKITTAGDVFELLRRELGSKQQEHFKLLSLDSRQKLLNVTSLFIGTADTSLAHPREIFRAALLDVATAVIFVHNHPSGDPQPSTQDILLTKKLIKAGKLLDIKVIDHIIITSDSYYSFQEGEGIG